MTPGSGQAISLVRALAPCFQLRGTQGKPSLASRLGNPEPQRYRCKTFQGLACDLLYAEGEGIWVLERV